MSRPHPVVDLAAVVRHHLWRCVDEPHVRDLLELGEREEQPAIERGELAAGLRLRLARRDDGLLGRIDGAEARDVVGRRRDGGEHLARDIAEGARHLDAIGLRRLLVGARAREVAVLAEVGLRRRVLLQDRHDAVVVGDEQAVGRDEASGTAGQLHRVGQQAATGLRVPEPVERQPEAPGRDPGLPLFEHLLRRPLAFVAAKRHRNEDCRQDDGDDRSHRRTSAAKPTTSTLLPRRRLPGCVGHPGSDRSPPARPRHARAASQSMRRVSHITAASAANTTTAPTSSARSSSCSRTNSTP